MRDKLEKFIHENRTSFDDRSPRANLWDKINEDMDRPRQDAGDTGVEPKVRRIGFVKWIGIAASVALLIGMGIVIGWNTAGNTNSETALIEEAGLEEDVESYYRGQVNRRLQRLAKYEYAGKIEKDLQEMDTYLQDLKKELLEALPEEREAIVAAMINNYKSRIKLLEKVLKRIEPTHSSKKNKSENEGTNI